MKTMFKAIALATVAVGSVAVSTPTMAQSRVGVAVADEAGAVATSAVYQNAVKSIQTTYATQIQQAETRQRALQAELQPLATAYQTAANQPNATQQSVAPAAQALQTKQQAAEREMAALQRPVLLARAYAEEQVVKKLTDAITNTMRAKKVDLLVQAGAVLAREPYVDITKDIAAELSRLVPSVSVTPPAGWQPGGQQQQAAPAAAPAPAKPKGR